MALIKNPLSGGGGGGGSISVVNGIIEQYKASSGTIDANTFVEFVNDGPISVGEVKQLTNMQYSASNKTAIALPLDDTHVILLHCDNGVVASEYLYGVVCTISGTSITLGTDTRISTSSGSGTDFSGCTINSSTIFVTHAGDGTYPAAQICTISGDTITAGTETTISSSATTTSFLNVTMADSSHVFVSHCGSSTQYRLFGIACSFSGTSITAGTDTSLVTSNTSGQQTTALERIADGKVFVAYNESKTTAPILAKVVTISGTTITSYTGAQIINYYPYQGYRGYILRRALSIGNDMVLFVSIDSNRDYIYGTICTVYGNTITGSADVTLAFSGGSRWFNIVMNDGNPVLAFYKNGKVQLTTCKLNGGIISTVSTSEVTTAEPGDSNPMAVVNNNIFIGFTLDDNMYYVWGTVVDMNSVKQAVAATDSKTIQGLTAQSITDTTAGDVWVLNTNESE